MEFFTPWHFAIVVAIGFLLFFVGDKLPLMARSLGSSLRGFKDELHKADPRPELEELRRPRPTPRS